MISNRYAGITLKIIKYIFYSSILKKNSSNSISKLTNVYYNRNASKRTNLYKKIIIKMKYCTKTMSS